MSEQQTQDGMKALVDQRLQVIKSSMPHVRQSIEDKVAQIGPEAYALVRRGLRGEPGCFYALEAGHVVGTPFGRSDPRMQQLAQFLVRFGCAYVCIFPMTDDEARTYGTA
ncbi:hypothetical protein D3C71_843030 [compost metagenome]